MPHPMTPPGGGGRKGNSGAVGLLTSLAVFAVICGLILLFAGGSWGGSDADSPEVARHKRIVKASRGAAKAGQQAKAALEGANYGAAKRIIEEQQKLILRLQIELEGSAPATPKPGAKAKKTAK